MSRSHVNALSMCLITLLAGCASVPPPEPPVRPAPVPVDLLISNVTIYDGETLAPQTTDIVIEDGAFVSIGPISDDLYAEQTIDGTGLYMTPGLIDMHVHLRADATRRMDTSAFLAAGVTTVRDLGGDLAALKALEAELAASGVPGPRIRSTYSTLNGRAFASFHRPVTTPAEAAVAVQDLAGAGAVGIKVHRALSPALLPVIIEAARAVGLSVTGHVPLELDPLAACEAGMAGIEHVGSLIEARATATRRGTTEAATAYLLAPESQPLYDCLAARKVAVTPTLVVYPAVARSRTSSGPIPPEFVRFEQDVGRITARLHGAGVRLLAGSDTSDLPSPAIPPGASLIEELQLLERAGIPAREIIPIATRNGADALGMSASIGTIALGKRADFILLAADPGASAAAFGEVTAVFVDGQRVAGTPSQPLPAESPTP